MPWKSKAQRGYMWAKHPEIAHEFEEATPRKKMKRLPQHVSKMSLSEITKTLAVDKYGPLGDPEARGHGGKHYDIARAQADVKAGYTVTRRNEGSGKTAYSRIGLHPNTTKRVGLLKLRQRTVPDRTQAAYYRGAKFYDIPGRGDKLKDIKKAVAQEQPQPQPKEHKRLIRGKLRQKHFSEAGAVLGLTALGATAPKAARHVVSRFPKVAHSKPLKALARLEPKANAVSAAATPLSLGTGALGSINFARQQGLEAKIEQRKPVAKSDNMSHRVRYEYEVGGKRRKANYGPVMPKRHAELTVNGEDSPFEQHDWITEKHGPDAILHDVWHEPHKSRKRKPVAKEDRIEASLSELRKGYRERRRNRKQAFKDWNAQAEVTNNLIGDLDRHRESGTKARFRPLTEPERAAVTAHRAKVGHHPASGWGMYQDDYPGVTRVSKDRLTVPVSKDRFTQKYGQNISEGAENAYNDLGRRKRRRYSDATLYGTGSAAGVSLGALTGLIAAHPKTRMTTDAGSVPLTRMQRARWGGGSLAGLAAGGALGYGAVRRAQEGRSLQQRRNKIKAKGYERAELGQRGRGRPVVKADLVELSKLWRPIHPIMPIKPRAGGLMRLANGRQVARRGAIVGTSPVRRFG